MSISVSIVEDDAQVRASLARLIDSSAGYRCVSQTAAPKTRCKTSLNTSPT